MGINNKAGIQKKLLPSNSSEFWWQNFKNYLYFPQYYTVLDDKCFPEVLGESKSNVKKVMWSEIVQLKIIKDDPDMLYLKYIYSYDSDYLKIQV